MKILHLCLDSPYTDGFSYQENLLVKHHKLMGHDVTVIASVVNVDKKGRKVLLKDNLSYVDKYGINIIRLPYKFPQKFNEAFRYYHGLSKALNNECPDIVFSHNMGFGDTSVLASYLKKNPSVKLFCDNHVDFINCGNDWVHRVLFNKIIRGHYAKKLIPYMTMCFGVTPMRCRYAHEMLGIPYEKIDYLPLGVDDTAIPSNRQEVRRKIRLELKINDSDFVIFTGGKIDKRKNTHVLLEALKHISNDKIHLIICGALSVEMQYLEGTLVADSNIHYLGWCDADKIMNCMIASDLACFPGTHSTLWEQSVGMGLPSIFKLWKEMDHLNINGNCIYLDGDDCKQLVDAIISVISSEKYGQMSEFAKRASCHFLYSEIAKRAIGLHS